MFESHTNKIYYPGCCNHLLNLIHFPSFPEYFCLQSSVTILVIIFENFKIHTDHLSQISFFPFSQFLSFYTFSDVLFHSTSATHCSQEKGTHHAVGHREILALVTRQREREKLRIEAFIVVTVESNRQGQVTRIRIG